MKILYVANLAPLGSPLGYCPNGDWIASAFEELGHKVTKMNEADVTSEDVIYELNKGYDLLLTEEGRLKGDFLNDENSGRDVVKGYFQEVMDVASVPVVVWLTNIFYGIMRRQEQIRTNPIFKADIVFSTDGGHQKEFEEAGVNHVLLRQGIYEPEAYITDERFDTNAEVGFLGGIYENIWPYRKELVEWLQKTYGNKFEHFGLRGEIRHHPLNQLCSTLKIMVGDSVYSPNYWSNRIYEVIGRGGFLIHPMIEGLEEEFTPYKHFIPYHYGDFEGLKEKIDYYLTHDTAREKIRRAGFEHCKEHHTYQKRVAKMLEILKERKIIGH